MLLAATLLVPLLLIRLLSVADLTSWSQLEDAMSSSDTFGSVVFVVSMSLLLLKPN